MTPEMQTFIPQHIKSVLDQLNDLHDELSRDAAAIISAFLAQAAPDHVTVCLTTNTARRAGVTVSLTPNQAVLLHVMAEKFPLVASVRDMHHAIWGAGTERSINTVRVMMTDLRKRLAPLKVSIANQNGHGYRLELLPVT